MVKIKEWLIKKNNRRIISFLLFSGLIASTIFFFKPLPPKTDNHINNPSKVTVLKINTNQNIQSQIKTLGTVTANNKVEVVATTGGTLQQIYFAIGDRVNKQQLLAHLRNNTTLTNLQNAQTNLINSQKSWQATNRLTNETIGQSRTSIKQAQIGITNAQKSIEIAKLGLKNAEDNLYNAKSLLDKANLDLKQSAVINFNSFINTIFNALKQIDQLIHASSPTPLNPALGAKDINILNTTQANYNIAQTSYQKLITLSPNTNNITNNMSLLVKNLAQTETLLNSAIELLDNSVSDFTYPQNYIDSQNNALINLRSLIISAENSAENINARLKNIPLENEQEFDNLKNAVSLAQAQLTVAQNAKQNAELAFKLSEQNLASTQESKNQQLISSQSQIDNARGQFQLSADQNNKLNITAPIEGIITQKYVDIGTEITPGQKIAEISQINILKIIAWLNEEDLHKIKSGQKLMINKIYPANITRINPSADPINKKFKIEIIFNNSDNNLLIGTFVDLIIPIEKINKTIPNSIFIPLRALIIDQNKKFVFIKKGNLAKQTIVTTGQTDGTKIEILSGLANNDELIINGAKNLIDGKIINTD